MAARRASGPAGKHLNPRRQLVQTPEEYAEQDAAAAAVGLTWAEWMRQAARRMLRATKRRNPRRP